MNTTSNSYPPPWDLEGEGFILPFWANEKKVFNWMSEQEQKDFVGGLGAIMFVNYKSSNVGPYYELLFIPGDFQYKGEHYKKITKIYVSSQLSLQEGRKNWGIPKELAEFEWKSQGDVTFIKAWNETGSLSVQLSKYFISFPISTALLPFTLLQNLDGLLLKTRFIGKGMGKLSSVETWQTEGNFFPSLSQVAKLRLPALQVSPFSLVFPTPTKVPI